MTARRMLDICGALVLLLLLAPLGLLIALLIRIEDGGPVFYAQERIGLGGGRFRILKFRALRKDADLFRLPPRVDVDALATRVGLLLRRSGLNELPQLWNVLRGEMALVGPRPDLPEAVARHAGEIPGYLRRHQVAPGITGLAQVYLSALAPERRKTRLDLLYVRRASVGLDLRVLAKTAVFCAAGMVDATWGADGQLWRVRRRLLGRDGRSTTPRARRPADTLPRVW